MVVLFLTQECYRQRKTAGSSILTNQMNRKLAVFLKFRFILVSGRFILVLERTEVSWIQRGTDAEDRSGRSLKGSLRRPSWNLSKKPNKKHSATIFGANTELQTFLIFQWLSCFLALLGVNGVVSLQSLRATIGLGILSTKSIVCTFVSVALQSGWQIQIRLPYLLVRYLPPAELVQAFSQRDKSRSVLTQILRDKLPQPYDLNNAG